MWIKTEPKDNLDENLLKSLEKRRENLTVILNWYKEKIKDVRDRFNKFKYILPVKIFLK